MKRLILLLLFMTGCHQEYDVLIEEPGTSLYCVDGAISLEGTEPRACTIQGDEIICNCG